MFKFFNNKKVKVDFIVAGLGNFGNEYENTRHNVGFMFIDKLCKNLNISLNEKGFNGIYKVVNVNNKNVLIIKPLTYMNNSGVCLKKACDYFNISLNKILVVVDDIYLPLSKIRIRKKGSHGGQNGIKSVINNFKSEEFLRIKVGIDCNKNNKTDLAEYVLSKFNNEELNVIDKTLENTVSAFYLLLDDKFEEAQRQFN